MQKHKHALAGTLTVSLGAFVLFVILFGYEYNHVVL